MPGPLSKLSFDLLPVWGVALLFLASTAIVLFLGMRARLEADPVRRWVSIALRIDLFLFLSLLIGGARYQRELSDLTVIAVEDVSRSIEQADGSAQTQTLEQLPVRERIDQFLLTHAAQMRSNDRMARIHFDGQARIAALPAEGFVGEQSSTFRPHPGTDVAAGINLALATVPADTLGRIVLFWDGQSTTGDLQAAVRTAAAVGVPIDVVPLRYKTSQEISVERLIAPAQRNAKEPVSIEVMVRSQHAQPVAARLHVERNGAKVDLDRNIEGLQEGMNVRLEPGLNAIRIMLDPLESGAHAFRAWVEVDSPEKDRWTQNNSAEAITIVSGVRRVLLVSGEDSRATRPLVDALAGQGLIQPADVISPAAFPRTLAELLAFDAIILMNVSRGRDGLSDLQDRLLTRYVHDIGGGLIVIGGPQALGAGGWIESSLAGVLPVELSPENLQIQMAGALALVIDRSGSMTSPMAGAKGGKLQVAIESAVAAAESLSPGDQLGVITFDSNAESIIPIAPRGDLSTVRRIIRATEPGGGTNIYKALEEAVRQISRLPPNRVSTRHIILLTDGQSEGVFDSQLIQRIQDAGITLSTIAIGPDADTQLLDMLAQQGRGKFYNVPDASSLPRIFIREALTLRRPLIREAPFTPLLADITAPVLRGVDAVPSLDGFIATHSRDTTRTQVALLSPTGEPIWAQWRAGLGQAGVFTSDATSRWAGSWIESPLFTKFWTQAVRTIARPAGSTDILTEVVQESPSRVRLRVERSMDSQANTASFSAIAFLLSTDPDLPPIPVPLRQSAGHLLEGVVDLPQPGTYAAVTQSLVDDTPSLSIASISSDPNIEFRSLESDEQAIREVARQTGGRVIEFNSAELLYDRSQLDRKVASRSLTDLLLILSIVTLLLDVAARRISWTRSHDARSPLTSRSDASIALTGPTEALDAAGAGLASETNRESVDNKIHGGHGTQRASESTGAIGAFARAREAAARRFEVQPPDQKPPSPP
jgi:uncharacterized protein YegL